MSSSNVWYDLLNTILRGNAMLLSVQKLHDPLSVMRSQYLICMSRDRPFDIRERWCCSSVIGFYRKNQGFDLHENIFWF